MIVWSGMGILVPIIFALAVWISSLFFEDYTFQNNAFVGTAMLIAALPIGLLGLGLEVPDEPEEGQEPEEPGHHSFFFIPMKWWGLICIGLGIYLLVT